LFTNNGNLWPTAEQELLLRASILAGDEALKAYQEWAARVSVEDLDYGSQRMLPLLYRNLQRLGVDAPLLDKLKGTYRLTFYQNKLAYRRMVAVLQAFAQAGIDTLVLKGVALVALYYKDSGVRPMSDLDLLVPPEQALTAVDLLQRQGWKPLSGPPITSTFISVHNSWAFRHADGTESDLHWYIFDQCCYPQADADLWRAAVSAQVDGFPIRALGPTDQLLHTCVHGAEWNPFPPLRWIADALIILNRAGNEVAWERLVEQAKKRRLVLATRDTLAFLREKFDAPVPGKILQELRSVAVTRMEQREYQWRTSPRGKLYRLQRIWFGYLRDRLMRPENARPHFLAFPEYLQRRWGAAHLWEAPIIAARLAPEILGMRASRDLDQTRGR
jgi:hypothetical protein